MRLCPRAWSSRCPPRDGSALCTTALILLWSGLPTGTASSATAPPDDPLLESFIHEALENQPEIAQGVATVAAEQELVPQVGALPDPTLTLGLQNDSFTQYSVGKMETSWYTIMLTQVLFWPGKQGRRRDVAGFQPSLAGAALQRTRLSIEADVRRSYLALQLVRDLLKLLSKQEALWEKSEKLARARYSLGEAPQSDLLRAQLQLTRLRQQRLASGGAERVRVEALNRLRVHPLDEPIVGTPSLEELGDPELPTVDSCWADAQARSPELLESKLGIAQASSRLDLAHLEGLPDFSVSAGVMPRGKLEPMWQVLLGISLPVYPGDKQDRAIEEATNRRTANTDGQQAVLQLLRLRTEQRHALLEVLRSTNGLYRDVLLVQSEATATSTLAQYEVGKVPFASVLDALNGLLADHASYLESVAEAHRISIAQRELSLEEPPTVGASMGRGPSMPSGGTSLGVRATPAAGLQGGAEPSSTGMGGM